MASASLIYWDSDLQKIDTQWISFLSLSSILHVKKIADLWLKVYTIYILLYL